MAKLPRLKKERDVLAPERGPVMSPRFAIALVLMIAGAGWVLYTWFGIRPEGGWDAIGSDGKPLQPGGPAFFADLEMKNYLIGFIAFFLGLMISAHPSTPLGRGRGVVVGMLGCFLVGLVWICLFYIFLTGDAESTKDVPILVDLGQKNLFVGIGFMAVGFAFATRWE